MDCVLQIYRAITLTIDAVVDVDRDTAGGHIQAMIAPTPPLHESPPLGNCQLVMLMWKRNRAYRMVIRGCGPPVSLHTTCTACFI